MCAFRNHPKPTLTVTFPNRRGHRGSDNYVKVMIAARAANGRVTASTFFR